MSTTPHIRLEDLDPGVPSVLSVGVFDGVHRGHRAVLDRVVQEAESRKIRSIVITFEPHPRKVLTGKHVPLLTTLEEKERLLTDLGIDVVVVVPFDRALSRMAPEDFVREVLVDRMGVEHMVIGYDHALGRNAAGRAPTITQLGIELGFSTEVVEPRKNGPDPVSSSVIKAILADDGDVAGAETMLGRAYRITGIVVPGDGRGKALGFPTANLEPMNRDKVVPANGVYAVRVERSETREVLNGVMNIGVRPTLTAGLQRVLEVHVLDFDDDIYGEELAVSFLERIRDEEKFDGVESLRRQIRIDVEDCVRVLESVPL